MKKRNIIIIFLLTLLVLYFSLKDNYLGIIELLKDINVLWFIVSYLLVLSYTFFKSIVTNTLILQYKPFKFIKTFIMRLIIFFFNAVTPFCTGGEPFQVYMLNKNNLTVVEATNTTIQETIIHQLSLMIVGIITIILNKIFKICDLNGFLYTFLIVGFLANLLVVSLLFLLSYNKKLSKIITNIVFKVLLLFKVIKNKEEKMKNLEDSLINFHKNSNLLLKDKRKFISLIILNSLAFVCLYLVPLTLLFSFNRFSDFNAITSIVIVSFVTIISSFVPLPGGTIGQEYVFITLFSIYINEPLLSSLMLIWRFTTYYLPLIIGAIIFNVKKEY